MKDFKTYWKTHLTKNMAPVDMYQYCLLKAMTAKTPKTYQEKLDLATIFLQRAFTPVQRQSKLAGRSGRPYNALHVAAWKARFTNKQYQHGLLDHIESEDEVAMYTQLCSDADNHEKLEDKERYSFVFVHKGLPSNEQIMIQAMHAFNLIKEAKDDTNLVVCQVFTDKDMTDAIHRFRKYGIKMYEYQDSYFPGVTSAVASEPISKVQKGFAKDFEKLKFV